jgi:hypothetical protein
MNVIKIVYFFLLISINVCDPKAQLFRASDDKDMYYVHNTVSLKQKLGKVKSVTYHCVVPKKTLDNMITEHTYFIENTSAVRLLEAKLTVGRTASPSKIVDCDLSGYPTINEASMVRVGAPDVEIDDCAVYVNALNDVRVIVGSIALENEKPSFATWNPDSKEPVIAGVKHLLV